MDTLTSRTVAECATAEVVDALNRAFEGYLLPVRFTDDAFERRFRGEHLDRLASRVYHAGGEPAGVVLVTRRGWTSRIGAMGVATPLRGKGVGRRMLQAALDDARARGDRAVLLEVFEQNESAVRLYERLGFRATRRLVGYRWAPGEAAVETVDVVEETDPSELARVAAREAEPGLPWQLAPETLAAAGHPSRAYRLQDAAYALVANPDAETLSLLSLVVPREHRRRGWGTRMLRALAAALPGRPWSIGQVVPDSLAPGFFVHAGWSRLPLNQFEMRIDLG